MDWYICSRCMYLLLHLVTFQPLAVPQDGGNKTLHRHPRSDDASIHHQVVTLLPFHRRHLLARHREPSRHRCCLALDALDLVRVGSYRNVGINGLA